MAAHVRRRPDSGAWEIRIYTGGEEIRRTFGEDARAHRRARRFAIAFNAAERSEQRRECEPIAVTEALREWLESHRETLSRSFEQNARSLIERHLVPFFGDRYVGELTAADGARFFGHMASQGLSPETARTALSIVRRVLALEVEAGRLDRNPFAAVGRLTRGARKRHATEVAEIEVYRRRDVEELVAIARESGRSWLAALILFLAATGARRGEALGLRWGDVDLERRVAAIKRARVRGVATSTKTGRARRVPLDLTVLPLLDELRRLAVERSASRPDDLVFLSRGGHPLEERNVARGWDVVRARAAARGVPGLRLHDFRHTMASHAIAAGYSPLLVATWLGHASPVTTLRVYAHVVLDVAELIVSPAPERGPYRVRPRPAEEHDLRCA